MKIRIVRLGGITHFFIIGPQDFVTFATSELSTIHADKRVDKLTEKLDSGVYRCMMRVE